MKNAILDSIKLRRITTVFLNPDEPTTFTAGFVIAISDTHLLFEHLTNAGLYDGYRLESLADMFHVAYDGTYETRLSILYSAQEQRKKHEAVTTNNGKLEVDLLRFAKEKGFVITINQLNNDYDDPVGFVARCDQDTAEIHCVDDRGRPNGVSIMPVSSITRIICDGKEEQALKILYEYHLKVK